MNNLWSLNVSSSWSSSIRCSRISFYTEDKIEMGKLKNNSLGRALIKDRFGNKNKRSNDSFVSIFQILRTCALPIYSSTFFVNFSSFTLLNWMMVTTGTNLTCSQSPSKILSMNFYLPLNLLALNSLLVFHLWYFLLCLSWERLIWEIPKLRIHYPYIRVRFQFQWMKSSSFRNS